MKKHNFLHRGIAWVERELEVTLAVLILLAAVVGYTFAGTEAVSNNQLTAQETSSASFSIGSSTYSTLAFDRSYTSGATYQIRKLSATPSSVATTKGTGLMGTEDIDYTVTLSLSAPFSGAVYVIGNSAGASLNGTTISSQNEPIVLTEAEKLILNFHGLKNTFKAISLNPASSEAISTSDIATMALVPATSTTLVGSERTFIAIVTDSTGAAISTDKLNLKWSVTTSPAGIATVSDNGVVTSTAEGVVTVKVISGTKSASATITVVAKPVAVSPATTPSSDTTSADKTATETTTDNGAKSMLDKITEVLTGSPAEAAAPSTSTTTEAKSVIAQATAIANAAYSPAVIAERVAKTGSTVAKQAEIKAIVETQSTTTGKIATRLNLAMNEMKQSFTEMAVGNKTVNKPSAIQSIFKWVKSISAGASAGTSDIMRLKAGGEDEID